MAATRPLPLLLLAAACGTAPREPAEPRPGDPLQRRGDEISVCGELFHTGTRVVLWNDPGGYDAYRREPRFNPPGEGDPGARYGSFRRQLPPHLRDSVRERGWTLDELRVVVHLFVLHYDVAGTSRYCFEILQDRRNLSVHFMLDTDGTIYQTLDLKERAWHATVANDHSVGIEIAHPGAYPAPDHEAFATWYGEDEEGLRMLFPPGIGDPGLANPDFIPRPSRSELVRGTVHGRDYWQYDFTPEQYRALAHLSAALSRVFPRIRLQVPRAGDGSVFTGALDGAALDSFEGLVGHLHVQTNKQDPGPALQWDRLLGRPAVCWRSPLGREIAESRFRLTVHPRALRGGPGYDSPQARIPPAGPRGSLMGFEKREELRRLLAVPHAGFQRSFAGYDLSGLHLVGADLSGAVLRRANLSRSDLSQARLQDAHLERADLRGSNLSDADLRGAFLQGADLSHAYLRGADLRGANLAGAELEGANLSGARLDDRSLGAVSAG